MKVRPLITFDDGCSGCMLAHEMLVERGMSATFYVCPGFIERTTIPRHPTKFITWDDVRELAKYHAIGAHSMTHPVFDWFSRADRIHEVALSQMEVSWQIDGPCTDWATPYGYWDEELRDIAEQCHFETFATTEFGANRPYDPMRLQRWEIHSPCPHEEFSATIARLSAC